MKLHTTEAYMRMHFKVVGLLSEGRTPDMDVMAEWLRCVEAVEKNEGEAGAERVFERTRRMVGEVFGNQSPPPPAVLAWHGIAAVEADDYAELLVPEFKRRAVGCVPAHAWPEKREQLNAAMDAAFDAIQDRIREDEERQRQHAEAIARKSIAEEEEAREWKRLERERFVATTKAIEAGVVTRDMVPAAHGADLVRKEIEPLPTSMWCGVWKGSSTYHPGAWVTDRDALWFCNRPTTARPGTSSDWTMTLKSGRRGKPDDLRR